MPHYHKGGGTTARDSWPAATWKYPLPHDFVFAFGLGADDATKNCTTVSYVFQDNALVDYELIKTNPENEDFATSSEGNCRAGSYVPRCMVSWEAFSASSEVDAIKFHYMNIHTSMLNRLDAKDKKSTEDIESILELTHEVTDEQVYPIMDNTKLYESHHVQDMPVNHLGWTTNAQP